MTLANILQALISIVARVALSAIFLMAALVNKIPNFQEVVTRMEEQGVPFPQIALVGAIAFLLVGGVSLVIGYKARFGSLLLVIFLALAAYYFHDFWNFEGQEQQNQMAHFMKNFTIAGALLFIMANGPGAGSVDALLSKSKK